MDLDVEKWGSLGFFATRRRHHAGSDDAVRYLSIGTAKLTDQRWTSSKTGASTAPGAQVFLLQECLRLQITWQAVDGVQFAAEVDPDWMAPTMHDSADSKQVTNAGPAPEASKTANRNRNKVSVENIQAVRSPKRTFVEGCLDRSSCGGTSNQGGNSWKMNYSAHPPSFRAAEIEYHSVGR